MLGDGDLMSMREAQAAALPDVGEIWRRQRVGDGMGGFGETFTRIATVMCRIRETGERSLEGEIARRHGAMLGYVVTMPFGQDVQMGDQVRVLGRVFEVVWVAVRSYETARRVVCVEVV